VKTIWAVLLFSASVCGQDLSLFIDNSGALTPLPSTYTFQTTAAGSSTSVTLRVANTSANPIEIVNAVVSTAQGSTVANTNFSITGLDVNSILAPGGEGFEDFTITFNPLAAGQATGYLIIAYAEQQNGCTLSSNDSTTQCPTIIPTNSPLLQGTAGPPQLLLTYSVPPSDNSANATPGTTIQFGNIAVGSSQAIIFTLTNPSADTVNVPSVTVQSPGVFAVNQFSITSGPLPPTLAGSATANFTVTFTPQANAAGTAVSVSSTLVIGSNSYPLQGTALPAPGTPVGSDGLQVICTDKTGAHCQASGTTIPMGPDPNTMALLFTVVNPNPAGTAYATLTAQPSLSSSSSAFSLGTMTLAPYASGVTGSSSPVSATQPITIQPGWALTFQVTFSPGQAATASGTLAIATGIAYSLAGKAPAPLNLTLMCGTSPCNGQPFTSQQQVQASLQWADSSSAQVPPDVTLALAFQSAVNGITSDPAISFIAPANSSNIGPISFSQNSAAGTFTSGSSKGQSQFTFQTGTTAGTITITATGLENVTQSWSFDIPPSKVQITSVSAQRQASNVVVTVDGYDNTYSAGQLSFTFYTITGAAIAPGAITVNASSNFHQYFFNNDQAGGAFALQGTFPVNGDVTQIGSVAVSVSNSAGTTSTTQAF
jgi:hypothetical protein